MPVKVLSQEDRTGEVWYPFGFEPSEEAFVITGPPSVVITHPTRMRILTHPIVHLRSGLSSTRVEQSWSGWIRHYVPLI